MPYVGKKPADIIATSVDTDTGTFSGDIDASTVNATGDTAAGDNAAIGFTSAEGLILTGQGSTNDVTIKNDADADVIEIPTGTVNVTMAGTLGVTGAVTANAGVVVDNITIDGTEIDLSSGNLTIDVAGQLVINSDSGQVVLQDDTVNWGNLQNSSGDFVIESLGTDKDMIFKGLDGSSVIEAARFDMSNAGMFLLGKSASAAANTGIELHNTGSIVTTVDGNVNIFLNRTSSDGEMIELRRDNSALGKIGILTGDMQLFSTTSNHGGFTFGNGNINPCSNTGAQTDNAMDLGASSVRYQDVFAANGVTTTSDRNEKQDIEELTDAEKRVAIVVKGLMRKYRWKDAVAKKGDKARTHFGIIAQDLQDAFTAESLDASKYAMFCSDTWWEKEITVDAVEAVEEVKDEEGDVTTEAVEAKEAYTYMDNKYEATEGYTEKTRLGVRYNELLAFIISAL